MTAHLIEAQDLAVDQYARLTAAQRGGHNSHEFFARPEEIAITNQILLLLVRHYDETHPAGS